MQQLLLSDNFRIPAQFGGECLNGQRKNRRPFSSKDALHVVMRSTLATGGRSFLLPRNANYIRNQIDACSKRFGIRVYRFSINSNHTHFLLRARKKRDLTGFLRVFSGKVASFIMGAKKGSPLQVPFWQYRPFSRIVAFGRAFKIALGYVVRNELESLGLIPYSDRQTRKATPRCDSS